MITNSFSVVEDWLQVNVTWFRILDIGPANCDVTLNKMLPGIAVLFVDQIPFLNKTVDSSEILL